MALMPLTFPKYEAAFLFSTTLLEPAEPISFVDLYVPANPFHSLANSVVPAVTLFAAAIGIALITLADKERFLIVPKGRYVVRRPLAYAMAPSEEQLAAFIDEWLVLQQARGNVEAAYDFWILGAGRRPT